MKRKTTIIEKYQIWLTASRNRWLRFISLATMVAYLVINFGYSLPTFAQISMLPCDGTLYISQAATATDFTRLRVLDGNTFTLSPGSGTAGIQYNGMGFNVQDGFIYGIQPDQNSANFKTVYRIGEDGIPVSLGIPQIDNSNPNFDQNEKDDFNSTNARFFAGDFDDNGTYLVYAARLGRIYKIDLTSSPPQVQDSVQLGGEFTFDTTNQPNNDFADLAFNPVDGKLYGVNTGLRELASIDPNTGTVDYLVAAPTPGSQENPFGAVFFDARGRFFAYENGVPNSQQGTLYRIDNLSSPIFQELGNADGVSFNDGSACAYAPVIEKTVSPATVNAGNIVTYTYTVFNQTDLQVNDVTFTDRLPPIPNPLDGRTFVEGGVSPPNPLGGTVTGLGTGTLQITGMTVPARTQTSFTVQVQIPLNLDGLPGTFLNQGTINGTVGGTTTSAQSDEPTTPSFPDPTPLTVNPNPVNLVPSKTVEPIDSNGNGAADPGEQLRYTITIQNTGTGTSTNTILTEDIPANTTYVPSSTALNGNAVSDVGGVMPFVAGGLVNSPGEPAGTINPGESATVQFRVTINNPLPPGVTEINNIATVTSDQVETPVSTDNPDTPGNPNDPNSPEDPTTVPIGGGSTPVAPTINKSVSFLRDNDNGGSLTIGDDVEYKVIVRNPSSTQAINNVVVSDIVPIQVRVLRDASNFINIDAPANSGFALAPTFPNTSFDGTGNAIPFTNGGTLPPGEEVTITYNARILPGAASPITNQALANYAGDGGNPIRSDASDSTNPTQPGSGNNPGNPDPNGNVNQPNDSPNDPTIVNFATPVNPAGTKSVRLSQDTDGSGSLSTGDIVEYTITYTNSDPSTDINNFQATDSIDTNGLRFVSGSYSFTATPGTTVGANTNYNGTTNPNLNTPGILARGGGQVVIQYQAEVIAGPGVPIRNQAIANFTDNTGDRSVPTDAIQKPGDLPQTNNGGDPNNPRFDDPTVLTVEEPMTPTRPVANKSVRFLRDNDNSGTLTIGDDIQYTIIVRNPNPTRTLNNVVLSEILPIQVRVLRDSSNPITVDAGFSLNPNLPISSFNGTGNPIRFTNPGTLPPTGQVTLTLNAQILPGAANPITNQGLVNFEGDGGNPVLTDASDTSNPTQPGSGNNPGNPRPVGEGGNVNQPNDGATDPTILNFVSPVTPTGSKSVRLVVDADNSESVTTGDTLEYTIIYTNPGANAPITNVLISDQIEADKVSFVPDSYNFRRVDGSGSAGNTTVQGNPSFNGTTDQNLTDPNNRGQLGTSGGRVIIMYSVRITAGAGTQIQNQATAQSNGGSVDFSLTDALSGLGDDGTPDLPQTNDDGINQGNLSGTGDDDPTLVTVGSPGSPRLRLVKRITNITRDGVQVSGINFNSFIDDPTNADDDVPGWNQRPPVGIVQLGAENNLQSGDEVEYTIYFLSDGGTGLNGIRLCDAIPEGTSFMRDSFTSGQGIVLNRSGNNTSLTNALDTDLGTFLSELTPANPPCPSSNNPNGSVLVNIGNIPTTAPDNVGFIRFRARID
ncbi:MULTISPECIES: DUF6923 family protein [unclassified Coleofasciculus]|uniref:DUF6923 family protein n=1 Tax=unclassified Coleofasciculus TaxID=2692782 RepID=UPI0018825D0B|nr:MULTISPECIES: DUF11 domain-containing protein [unclassified Coleofasciculus]MBE9125462.1 DUF11 domain-containing protein [Coleofasciculus sp. LEGE 07081]MBE9147433.1 DUF11 domain-containing protein [Coleofasciculus sp. LEGE 07092]